MSEDRKDSEWLKGKLVTLLEAETAKGDPDVPSCAKIADLLWKMLPRASILDADQTELAAIRKRLIEGDDPEAD